MKNKIIALLLAILFFAAGWWSKGYFAVALDGGGDGLSSTPTNNQSTEAAEYIKIVVVANVSSLITQLSATQPVNIYLSVNKEGVEVSSVNHTVGPNSQEYQAELNLPKGVYEVKATVVNLGDNSEVARTSTEANVSENNQIIKLEL